MSLSLQCFLDSLSFFIQLFCIFCHFHMVKNRFAVFFWFGWIIRFIKWKRNNIRFVKSIRRIIKYRWPVLENYSANIFSIYPPFSQTWVLLLILLCSSTNLNKSLSVLKCNNSWSIPFNISTGEIPFTALNSRSSIVLLEMKNFYSQSA